MSAVSNTASIVLSGKSCERTIPGSTTHRCVAVRNRTDARSHSFIVGNFRAYRDGWDGTTENSTLLIHPALPGECCVTVSDQRRAAGRPTGRSAGPVACHRRLRAESGRLPVLCRARCLRIEVAGGSSPQPVATGVASTGRSSPARERERSELLHPVYRVRRRTRHADLPRATCTPPFGLTRSARTHRWHLHER